MKPALPFANCIGGDPYKCRAASLKYRVRFLLPSGVTHQAMLHESYNDQRCLPEVWLRRLYNSLWPKILRREWWISGSLQRIKSTVSPSS